MSVIAHITDVHLVEKQRSGGLNAAARRSYLNFGRAVDEAARRRSFEAALAHARALGFDHLVISGDLTEEGTIPQFEAVAEALGASGVDPSRVTLVPGNHDVYAHAASWSDALRGPLAPYAAASAPGAQVELADAVLAPVSTARAQRWWRSAGEVSTPERAAVAAAVRRAGERGVPAVLVQHHPPMRVHRAVWHWFDGLLDHAAVSGMLRATDHVYVLHGHLHERRDACFEGESKPRIFGAAAVLDDPRALRRYRVADGALVPLDEATAVEAVDAGALVTAG